MSVFAHLAFQFQSPKENLATEALGYILGRSEHARHGFVASLGSAGAGLPSDLRFDTQASSETQGRPDLAALDDHGRRRLLVEAKFDAGFTEHQPVDYLDQLPDGGVLVVVGPKNRLPYLWRELLLRLREANRTYTESEEAGDVRHALVGQRHLVLQSWSHALHAIRVQLDGESDVLADVAQLQGLCDRMDTEAFVPVSSEELSSNAMRRVHEFGGIVDDVAAMLTAEGVVSKKGARATAANGWYGRYARLRGAFVLFQVNTWAWAKFGGSPLWLVVFGSSWKSDPAPAKKLLTAFEAMCPGTVFTNYQGYPLVKLSVPAGAERREVVKAIADQLRDLGERLAPLGEGAPDAPPPEVPSDILPSTGAAG